ncbi:hypothetical protein CT113_03820 [Levilactobacillus brevis]|uniref:nucleotidyltransferase domain-containing protein n=1 Tax=Levilactobacillus brevis TaxID=1580 RepID=UPI00041CDAD7|nr:nucleotidyltransferase domain-containing protein [Levilactobacillus brevis]ATU69513.1 hypothetical protein CT113_03820 [Levilactobacillus brevis]
MNYLPKETLEYMREKTDEPILAVYLTGSYLNNLNVTGSDLDYYVVTFPPFEKLIFNRNEKVKQVNGDVDFKVMDLFHFISLVFKANPNVIELFYREPLYVNATYQTLGEWLKNNRKELPMLNSSGWERACIGLMIHSYQTFKRNKAYQGSGSDGKEAVNFFKAFQYFTYELNKGSLEGVVTFDDDLLRQWALEMKSYENVSDKEREQVANYMVRQIDAVKLNQGELERMPVPDQLMSNLIKTAKRTYFVGEQLLEDE